MSGQFLLTLSISCSCGKCLKIAAACFLISAGTFGVCLGLSKSRKKSLAYFIALRRSSGRVIARYQIPKKSFNLIQSFIEMGVGFFVRVFCLKRRIGPDRDRCHKTDKGCDGFHAHGAALELTQDRTSSTTASKSA